MSILHEIRAINVYLARIVDALLDRDYDLTPREYGEFITELDTTREITNQIVEEI